MSSTNLQYVVAQDELPVVILTLNRPEQRNALSTGLMRELTEQLNLQSQRTDCRIIVLRGAGPAFSAGHDLR